MAKLPGDEQAAGGGFSKPEPTVTKEPLPPVENAEPAIDLAPQPESQYQTDDELYAEAMKFVGGPDQPTFSMPNLFGDVTGGEQEKPDAYKALEDNGTVAKLEQDVSVARKQEEQKAIADSKDGSNVMPEDLRQWYQRTASGYESPEATKAYYEDKAGKAKYAQEANVKNIENARRSLQIWDEMTGGKPLPPQLKSTKEWLDWYEKRQPKLETEQQRLEKVVSGETKAPPLMTLTKSTTQNVAGGLQELAGSIVEGAGIGAGFAGRLMGADISPEDNSVQRFGAWIQDKARELFPGDKERQTDFSQKLARGAGSAIGFYGPGAILKIMGASNKVLTTFVATTGALAEGSSTFNEAMKSLKEGRDISVRGSEELGKFIAFAGGIFLGATEALPIARMMERKGGGYVYRTLVQMAEEGGQESFQTFGENYLAKVIHDPERELMDGVVENGAIGAILGGLMQGGQFAFSREARQSVRDERAIGVQKARALGFGGPAQAAPAQPAAPAAPAPTAQPTQAQAQATVQAAPTQAAPAAQQAAPPAPRKPARSSADLGVGEPIKGLATPAGAFPTELVTPDGSMAIPGKYEWVEAGETVAAKGDIQGRDVNLKERANKIQYMGANYDALRTMPSRSSDVGSPAIEERGTTISGNSRMEALLEVYRNPALAAVAERTRAIFAAQPGGAEAIAKLREPALVFKIDPSVTPEQLVKFADLSNRSSIEAMGPSELGRRDAAAAGADIMRLYEGGEFTSERNREFMRSFMQAAIPPNEMRTLSQNGILTPAGDLRLAGAVLAEAYQDPRLLDIMLESKDDNIKAITGALRDAAGPILALKQAVANGETDAEFDVTPSIVEAALFISHARQAKQTIADALAQEDLVNRISPLAEMVVRAFYNENLTRPISRKGMTEFIISYATEAKKHSSGGLIPDATTPQQIIDISANRVISGQVSDLTADITDTLAESAGVGGGLAAGDGTTGSQSAVDGGGVALDQQAGDVRDPNLEAGAVVQTSQIVTEEDGSKSITLETSYSDGTKTSQTYRAVRRTDGTFGLEVIEDGKPYHFNTDFDWAKGGVPRSAIKVGGVAHLGTPPESFPTADSAMEMAFGLYKIVPGQRRVGTRGLPEATSETTPDINTEEFAAKFVPGRQASQKERKGAVEAGQLGFDLFADEPPTQDMRAAFRSVLAGKAPQKEWAGLIGATTSQIETLELEAINEGLLRQTKTGQVRRTPLAKEGAAAPEQAPAEAVNQAADPSIAKGPPLDTPLTVVFGGSFNPIHEGHAQAIRNAVSFLKTKGYSVSRVVIAPTPDKLLKDKLGDRAYPLEDRAAMARLQLANDAGFVVETGPALEVEQMEGKPKRTQLANWAMENYQDGSNVINVTGEDAAPGSPPMYPSAYQGDPGTSHEGYYYLAMPRDEGDGMSSSTIRKALVEGKPVPEGMMVPEAQSYLMDLLNKNPTLLTGETPKVPEPPPPVDIDAPNFGLPQIPKTLPDGHPLLKSHWGNEKENQDTSPEREAMRERLIQQRFEGKKPSGYRPIAYVMGGGSASGKGTVLQGLEEAGYIDDNFVFLDPDGFKTGEKEKNLDGIPEYQQILDEGDGRAAGVVHEESSHIFKRARDRAMNGGYDIVLDRTLGNPKRALEELDALEKRGYRIILIGVSVRAELAIDRAVDRAKKVNRWVPLNDALKTHKGFSNGFESYAEIAHTAILFDTEVPYKELPLVMAVKDSDVPLTIVNESAYNNFRKKGELDEEATTLRTLRRSQAGVAAPVLEGGMARGIEEARRAIEAKRAERAGGLPSGRSRQIEFPEGADPGAWYRSVLLEHGVNPKLYGKDQARSLEKTGKEIADGEVRLVVENGELIREADVVGIDVYANIPGQGRMRLTEDRQEMKDGRVVRREGLQAVSEKLLPGEDPATTVGRALEEELGVTQFKMLGNIVREPKEPFVSPRYPGLKSRYIVNMATVEIQGDDIKPGGYVEEQKDKTNYFLWQQPPPQQEPRLPSPQGPVTPPPALSIPTQVRMERAVAAYEQSSGTTVNAIVSDYATQIFDAQTDVAAVSALVDQISKDKVIRKTDALVLAQLVGYPPKKSTTKKAALESIVKRAQELADNQPVANLFAQEQADVSNGPDLVERAGGDGAAADRLGQANVPAPAGGYGQPTQPGGTEGGQGIGPVGGTGVPSGNAAALGEPSDLPFQEGEAGSGLGGSAAERGDSGRGGDVGVEGDPAHKVPAKTVVKDAITPARVKSEAELQAEADLIPVTLGDFENIQATLPTVIAANQRDILTAETAFESGKKGFLFTNGTGTGKTFLGAGFIKRQVAAGKGNILILAPSQGILDGWVKTGEIINLPIKRLENTKTAGEGVVATTYANLEENASLATRDWDFVIADEAHSLSQNKSGNPTKSLQAFRAVTNKSTYARANLMMKDRLDALNDTKVAIEDLKAQGKTKEAADLHNEYRHDMAMFLRDIQFLEDEIRQRDQAKVLFLSATPFAYRKSTDYAEGFLFDYPEESNSYGTPGGRDAFLVKNFGYGFRYNRAEEPGPEVNTAVLEREFYESLKRQGVLSGRRLEIEPDYDRRFILVDDAVGAGIDLALEWLNQQRGSYSYLRDYFAERFDYLSRRRLLEALKATHAVERIKTDMKMGRKVVVFHDYIEGGGINPFFMDEETRALEFTNYDYETRRSTTVKMGDLYDTFIESNPFVKDMNWGGLKNPIETLTKAFPDALVYNGRIPNKKRKQARDLFNDDKSGRSVIIVQSDAGAAGISLHDTTGKHQRILYNLGLPVRPTYAIQQEGRIYRQGQVSDAILRYMSTGTSWERWAFSQTIAERASTAENLALGNEARRLRDSFINSFNDASEVPQNKDEGKGGKAYDRADTAPETTDYERAKAMYFTTLKNRSKRSQREGNDYYATPEPIGLKMVEFADVTSGESILEPSAGHGAISRWFTESANRTIIELSSNLASQAALNSPGAKMVQGMFEDFNTVNKFNGITMNPPFGSGGSLAFAHLQKATQHLRNGGRIVAILPRGGKADERYQAFQEDEANANIYVAAEIDLPGVTFERAGTGVNTRLVVFERFDNPEDAPDFVLRRDFSKVDTVADLFDLMQDVSLRERNRNPQAAPPKVRQPRPAPEAQTPTQAGVFTEAGGQTSLVRPVTTAEEIAAEAARRGRPAAAQQDVGGLFGDSRFQTDLVDLTRQQQAQQEQPGRVQPPPPAAAPPQTPQQRANAVRFTTGETKHTKTGKQIFAASIAQFVPRNVYEVLRSIAKKYGGNYSTFRGRGAIPGFHFSSEDNRANFISEASNISMVTGKPLGDEEIMPSIAGVSDQNETMPSISGVVDQIGQQIADNASEIAETIIAEAKRLLPADVAVRVEDSIIYGNISLNGFYQPAANLLKISLEQGIDTALATARHEAVHVSRLANLFTKEEWTLLLERSSKIGIDSQITADLNGEQVSAIPYYENMYRDQAARLNIQDVEGYVFEQLNQERVAKMLETRVVKGVSFGERINAILDRIAQLIEAIVNGIRGLGFQTAEGVMEQFQSGDIARRARIEPRFTERDAVLDGFGMVMPAISGWHGSPYDFEKFDITKIGTGEGAAAYSKGLYIGGERGVGEYYRDQLGRPKARGPKENVWDLVTNYGQKPENLENIVLDMIKFAPADQMKTQAEEMLKVVRDGSWRDVKSEGVLYEVRINAEPEDFLDWDKPLSQQPEKAMPIIQKFIEKLGPTPPDEAAIITAQLFDQPIPTEAVPWNLDEDTLEGLFSVLDKGEAEQAFREAGIPGVRYLDQVSRGQGKGTHNYVVYDDSIIEIVAKDDRPFGAGNNVVTSRDKGDGTRIRTYKAEDGFVTLSETQDGTWFIQFTNGNVAETLAEIEGDIGQRIAPDGWLTPDAYDYWSTAAPEKVMGHVPAGPLFNDMLVPQNLIQPALDTLNTVMGESTDTDQQARLARQIHALRTLQLSSGEIMPSIGRQLPQPISLGSQSTGTGANMERPEKSLSDLVTDTARALGIQPQPNVFQRWERRLGLTPEREAAPVRMGRLDPGLKRAAAKQGGWVAGQFSGRPNARRGVPGTGVTRLAIPNDLPTLAHEGGHALEVRYDTRSDIDALKRKFAEDLVLPPAPNAAAPPMPTSGFSGIEIDAETQAVVVDAVRKRAQLQSMAASVGLAKQGRGQSYDARLYGQLTQEAGAAHDLLKRRLGQPIADAVMQDVEANGARNVDQYVAQRFSQTGTPQPRPQLSYGEQQLSEAWADWFGQYVVSPQAAQAHSPALYQEFEDLIDGIDPGMLEQLNGVQEGYQTLLGADPVAALRSRVQSTASPGLIEGMKKRLSDSGVVGTISDWIYTFYTAAIDGKHPMKKAVKYLMTTAAQNMGLKLSDNERLVLKAIDDPYKRWRLGEHSKVHATNILQNGTRLRGQDINQGASFQAALTEAFGGTWAKQWNEEKFELFGTYLIARRMLAEFERYENGQLENMPDLLMEKDRYEQARAQIETQNPQFAQAAAILYQFNANILQWKFQEGFIDAKLYADLQQRNDYVPLNRIMDEDGGPSTMTTPRGANKSKMMHRFKGSTRDFINPLESIMQDVYRTQSRVALNGVIRAMDTLARAAGPGGGKIAERIPANEMRGTKVDLREVIKSAAKKEGLAKDDSDALLELIDQIFDEDASGNIFRATEINEKGERIAYLWEGGKRVPIRLGDDRLGKDIFDQMVAFGQNNANLVVESATLFTQALRAGVTKAPEYVFTNLLRDQLATWTLSSAYVPFKSAAKGIKDVVQVGEASIRYQSVAGMMGGVDTHLMDTASRKLDYKALRKQGFWSTPGKTVVGRTWYGFLRTMEITEAATRVGHFDALYQRAIADGMTKEEALWEAGYMALDVMDFSRRGGGPGMQAITRMIAFLNASVQALDAARRTAVGERNFYKNYRNMASPYLKATMGQPLSVAEKEKLPESARMWMKIVGVGMIGVALAALYQDDEEYEEFNDYMRATHWFFNINGTWYRWPKHFELAVASNAFEAAFAGYWKQDPRALKQFVESLKHTFIPPHEIQAAKFIYELKSGKDMFRDRDIIGMDIAKLPPELQYNAYTSELGKMIGKVTGTSPAMVDHFMATGGATVARDIMAAGDYLLPRVNEFIGGKIPGVSPTPRAEKSFEDYLFMSRFTRRAGRGALSTEYFWNQMSPSSGEYAQAAAGFKRLYQAGRADPRTSIEAQAFLNNLPDDQKAYAMLETYFSEKHQDLHPLNRARQVLSAASGLRKEMVMGEITLQSTKKKGMDPERLTLTISQKRAVNEIMEDIAMREARNSLIATREISGWENKNLVPTKGLWEELRRVSPEVADEFEARLSKGRNKVYSFEAVLSTWQEARKRLLKEGPDADLNDLVGEAVGYGREYSHGLHGRILHGTITAKDLDAIRE